MDFFARFARATRHGAYTIPAPSPVGYRRAEPLRWLASGGRGPRSGSRTTADMLPTTTGGHESTYGGLPEYRHDGRAWSYRRGHRRGLARKELRLRPCVYRSAPPRLNLALTASSNLGPRVRGSGPAAEPVEAQGCEEIEPHRVGSRYLVPCRPATVQFVARNH